jgi:hypothetical protein
MVIVGTSSTAARLLLRVKGITHSHPDYNKLKSEIFMDITMIINVTLALLVLIFNEEQP